MEDLFDAPKPLSSDAPVVPLGKCVFNAADYHLKVANAVVSAIAFSHQIREHDRNSIAAHFNKRKPDASDVALPIELPMDKYSAHIGQSGDQVLNTLLNDAQQWCKQHTYDGSKLSSEVLKSNLVLMLKKRLDAMFSDSPVTSNKQRQLNEHVFGVSSPQRTIEAPKSNTFSAPKPNTFSAPMSTTFAPKTSSVPVQNPTPLSIPAHGPTCGCGFCDQEKKKKKSKKHKQEGKTESQWRREVYSNPASELKPVASSALSVNVTDPVTGKQHVIELTPIAKQSEAVSVSSRGGSIFDTNKSVDVAGKWKPEYFGRIGQQSTPARPLSDQFLAYAATQLKNSNVNVIFMPTESKLAEVKALADKRGAEIPFDGLWSRHAAVHVNTTKDTHQARALSENIGSVYHDGKTLSVPKLGQHYVKILESKQQQLGGKTVTVHIHEGLFIQQ